MSDSSASATDARPGPLPALRWALVLGGVALAVRLGAGLVPAWVELAYARGFYPKVAWAMRAVSGRVGVALIELVLLALVLQAARALLGVVRGRARLSTCMARGAAWVAGLWLVFLAVWGLNYQRPPLLELTVWPEPERSAAALDELCAHHLRAANALRAGLAEDEQGFPALTLPLDEMLAGMQQGYRELPALPEELARAWAQPSTGLKTPLLGRLFSWVGITGIFVPFTGEPCLNPTLPVVDLLFAAAHELAHARGVAREDEANFLAWMACVEHPDPLVRYAGELAAVRYSMNQLFLIDTARGFERLAELDEAVKRDWFGAVDYWMEHQGPVLEVAEEVNDTYLQAQGEEEGVESYGRMVDLLLAAQVALAQ